MNQQSTERSIAPMALAAMTLAWLIGLGVIVIGAAAVSEGGGGGGSGEVEGNISLADFTITGDLVLPAGEVTLNVTNDGNVQHDLSVTELDKKTELIDPGSSASLELGELEPGTYEVFCSVAGHKSSGMLATLTIVEEGTDPQTVAAAGHDDHSDPKVNAANDKAMIDSMVKYVDGRGATEGVGNEILEPTVAADGTKEFEITAAITDWEVEPGKIVKAWTYNGQVPGPWIKLNVGDKVRINLTNDLPLITDIHFHGIHTPNTMDGVAPYTQDPVEPNGGKFTYEFVADKPAIGMYHAHAHGEVAVPNGMFGMFQIGDTPLPRGRTISGVEIPADLQVTTEMPMVVNDAGEIGYSLNGKSFPATAPLQLKLNQWALVHYQNEGLQVHPMHMHGFPQLVIAKDGIPLDQPYWSDTILVGPGERYSVLVQATDPGVWVWHCHILNHVEAADRLFGMATAVIVE